jgi:hypothetical protein
MDAKPMKALYQPVRRLALLVVALTAACAGDATAPAAKRLAPVSADRALSGVVDGVYTFVVNPGEAKALTLGDSRLTLPANSICSLTSTYGPSTWDTPCSPATTPITVTAIVRDAATNHPSIEFQPAMRFDPAKTVQLLIAVTNAETLSNMTQVLYCGPFSTLCQDESLADPSLATQVDKASNTVVRRVKHFSGYVVAE